MFPDSLFIYTTRSPASWLKSVFEQYQALGNDPRLPDGDKQFALEADVRIYGTVRPIECNFRAAYRRHHAKVMQYFRGQEDRLLTMNIVKDDGWNKLCPFLELPVIGALFAHANSSERARRRQERRRAMAAPNDPTAIEAVDRST